VTMALELGAVRARATRSANPAVASALEEVSDQLSLGAQGPQGSGSRHPPRRPDRRGPPPCPALPCGAVTCPNPRCRSAERTTALDGRGHRVFHRLRGARKCGQACSGVFGDDHRDPVQRTP
jgi:hypothetical protein